MSPMSAMFNAFLNAKVTAKTGRLATKIVRRMAVYVGAQRKRAKPKT